ncbi:MAG: transglutaminase-like domain-containing protein [Planctomycetota bacterium]|jgi:hypothetical protein
MQKLLFLNNLRWYKRWPVKSAVFGLTILAVCFPYPDVFYRHVRHWQDAAALIQPDAPALQPMIEELAPTMEAHKAEPAKALKAVETYVYDKIKYDWDWNTWGTADYMPTVEEAIEKGREDCDGRAVVAASLLQHFGYESEIVTNLAHVWVKTDKGETMGPGKHQAIVAQKDGTLKVNPRALAELPNATAYGLAVFPLTRELIILGVLWWLLLRRNGGRACGIATLLLLANGLLFMRLGGESYLEPQRWMQWLGIVNFAAGLFGLTFVARKNAKLAAVAGNGHGAATSSDTASA